MLPLNQLSVLWKVNKVPVILTQRTFDCLPVSRILPSAAFSVPLDSRHSVTKLLALWSLSFSEIQQGFILICSGFVLVFHSVVPHLRACCSSSVCVLIDF